MRMGPRAGKEFLKRIDTFSFFIRYIGNRVKLDKVN